MRTLAYFGFVLAHFFLPDVGLAGGFEKLGEVVGDVVSRGGNAHERDFQACVRAKQEQLIPLKDQQGKHATSLARTIERKEGEYRRIQVYHDQMAEIKRQNEKMYAFTGQMRTIEMSKGRLDSVIQNLETFSRGQNLSSVILSNWIAVIDRLIPSLSSDEQATARALREQIQFAANSNDTQVIAAIISVLNASTEDRTQTLFQAWNSLITENLKKIGDCLRTISEGDAGVAEIRRQEAGFRSQLEAVEASIREVESRSCG